LPAAAQAKLFTGNAPRRHPKPRSLEAIGVAPYGEQHLTPITIDSRIGCASSKALPLQGRANARDCRDAGEEKGSFREKVFVRPAT
jgi:hypothetical protein